MDFKDWLKNVGSQVDDRIRSLLEEKKAWGRPVSPDSVELIDAIDAFSLRGGKRLRPAMVAAAYGAVRPEGTVADTIDAGAALELLHSSLLMHDDWMDGDETRRGGPAVHVIFRDTHGDAHLGASLAILAGNLTTTYAWQLFTSAPFPAESREKSIAEFLDIQQKVYFGQHLDLTATQDVWRMHDLKTTSYTARGPLRVGALLGGATQEQLDALDKYGTAIGAAFQMRDDLLATFGDEKATGKAVGNDLRAGKRNALIRETERLLSEKDRAPITEALGRRYATDEEIAAAIELIVTSGARKNVEARIDELVEEALAAIGSAPMHKDELEGLAQAMAHRNH